MTAEDVRDMGELKPRPESELILKPHSAMRGLIVPASEHACLKSLYSIYSVPVPSALVSYTL